MRKLYVILLTLLLIPSLYQVYSTVGSTSFPIVLTTTCEENVAVYFLDVGQGDSILVKTASKNILIDGGPTNAGTTS